VNLSNGVSSIPGGVTANASSNVNIINDELPKLKVPNVNGGLEGSYAVFKPTIAQRLLQPYGVCWNTVDGTATVCGRRLHGPDGLCVHPGRVQVDDRSRRHLDRRDDRRQ